MSPRPRRRVDLATSVGSVALATPVLTASGTSGHGAELGAYLDLAELGAVVVKSLAADPWPGNPAPRVFPTPAGMLNSVGLQGPGVAQWLACDLPALVAQGATVVASIWGRSVDDFAAAAGLLAGAPGVVAVEVNVSCPNVEDRSRMFAHSPAATAEAVAAAGACGLPRWVKLSPNVPDLVEIAGAAIRAGAEGLVLVNTVLGMAVDPVRRTYRLGSGPSGGGLSGPAIRAVTVRAVHDCRAAFPSVGIVGVGGVCRGVDAAELLVAGADAVEVGTATFADPRAPATVLHQLERWCRRNHVSSVRSLVGAVHRPAVSNAPSPAVSAASGPAVSAASVGSSAATGLQKRRPDEPYVAPTGDPASDDQVAGANDAGPVADQPADLHPDLLLKVRSTLDAIDQRVAVQAEQVAQLTDALAALVAVLGTSAGSVGEGGAGGTHGGDAHRAGGHSAGGHSAGEHSAEENEENEVDRGEW